MSTITRREDVLIPPPELLPPGFNMRILRHTPRRHRPDVAGEAWVAFLEGRNANTAARNYVTKELLHERRQSAVSQLAKDDSREYRLLSHTVRSLRSRAPSRLRDRSS